MATPASNDDAMTPPSPVRSQPLEPNISPQPSRSSSSAVSRSLRYTLEGSSAARTLVISPTASSVSQSSGFSEVTRTEIERLAKNKCWACMSGITEACHVIPKEDKAIDFWAEIGLINFNLRSTASGIALCPNCHTEFDRAYEPGIVFIPVDVEYFIDFELMDQERRSGDSSLRRQVPTSEMYRNHLVEKQMIGPEAAHGLYRPVFLSTDCLPVAVGERLEAFGLTQPKEWHGAPLASLRRAFTALACSKIYVVGDGLVANLRTLFDLYFKPTLANPINLGGQSRPALPAERLFPGGDDDTHPIKRRKLDTLRDEDAEEGNWKPQQYDVRTSVLYLEPEWVLGPSSTAEDAVHRFASLFAQS